MQSRVSYCNPAEAEHGVGLFRSLPKLFVLSVLFCLITIAGMPRDAHALLVQIDTSSLTGTGAFEFTLFDGDGTAANNTATISGTAIQDFDSTRKELALGGSVVFDISFTKNFLPAFSGASPDLLVLNLLDPNTNFTLLDTNLDALSAPVPYQDALLVIDLSSGAILTPSLSSPNVSIAVPEPSTAMLFVAVGLLFLSRRAFLVRRLAART